LRIKATADSPQPFILEATFTHRIPDTPSPTRIWLDPADRIVFAYEGNRLAILFPPGRIPSSILGLMSAQELKELYEE
jgi:hypothetical protein